MKAAFTLIELLVVIVIVAVIAALCVPAYHRTAEMAKAVGCLSNLRQIGCALQSYLADNDNVMPELQAGRSSKSDDGPAIDTVLAQYADDPKVFACPGDRHIAADTGTSYYWNTVLNNQSILGLSFLTIDDLTRIPIIADKEAFHPYSQNKVNILYADGHATKELKFSTSTP
ncbi:MAG: prepilin-type N-terminal cleavage/methylation domain-containing protein [Chthoniobacteraceae bacterium]